MNPLKEYRCNFTIQTKEGSYICPYTTTKSGHLNRHLEAHLRNPAFKPSIVKETKKCFCPRMVNNVNGRVVKCSYSTVNLQLLDKHIKDHDNPDDKFKCSLKVLDLCGMERSCEFTTKFYNSLRTHEKAHAKRRARIGTKPMEQLLPSPLSTLPTTSPINSTVSSALPPEESIIESVRSFNSHQERIWKCDVCGFYTINVVELTRHMMAYHTSEVSQTTQQLETSKINWDLIENTPQPEKTGTDSGINWDLTENITEFEKMLGEDWDVPVDEIMNFF